MVDHFFKFLLDLFRNRTLIVQLTVRDFKTRYLGSYLGLLWAFIQPTVTILIFWFVFDVGFKSAPINNFPFLIWLVVGLTPWMFIAESLASGTGAILENSYLVQKVVFRVSIMPIVKIFSALIIHVFFIGVIFLLCLAYGIYPTLHSVQVVYYSFSMFVMLLGLSWLTSALVIFLKDVGQIVAMLLQFGFWMTPIFWSIDIIPAKYHFFIKLNPVCYVIQGYRECFITRVWFWEHPLYSLYYWGLAVIFFVVGALVFNRLRPHFAEVL